MHRNLKGAFPVQSNIKKFKTLICLFIVVTFSLPVFAKSSQNSVLFIAPGELSTFWNSVYAPMEVIAKQLDLELVSLRPDPEEGHDYVPILKKYLATKPKPNWVIWVHRRGSPETMLTLLERHKIYSINITNPIDETLFTLLGTPKTKYKYWQAQITSNEKEAAYNMVLSLLDKAKQSDLSAPYSLLSLTGRQFLKAARVTTQSMYKAVKEHKELSLKQSVYANWSIPDSYDKTRKLLKRYKKIDLIWAGSIDISSGTVKAVKETLKATDTKPIIVNLGFNETVIEPIKNNDIYASYGGNHLHGVWSLIIAYDSIHGKGLEASPDSNLIKTTYFKVDKNNIDLVAPIYQQEFWENIDIKRYSKYHNENLKKYDFNLKEVLQYSFNPVMENK